jgi:hypothetical protein
MPSTSSSGSQGSRATWTQDRVEVQVGAEAEGLGDLGGLPPQRVQGAVQGSAAMPEPPGRVVEVAAVAFGVDHEDPGGADDQVVDVGGRPGDGEVMEDLVAVPLQGSEQPGGAPLPLGAMPPRQGVG